MYALLVKAMVDTGYYAVAKVAMHGREYIVIIRPAVRCTLPARCI